MKQYFADAMDEALNVIALENERTPTPCRPRDKRLIPKFHPVAAAIAYSSAASLSLSATVSSLSVLGRSPNMPTYISGQSKLIYY